MKVTIQVDLELEPDSLTEEEADDIGTQLEYHLEQYSLVLTAQVIDWTEV